MAAPRLIRVLELYSGIGGMHWALTESGIPFSVLGAYDVNVNTNKIYKKNFPDVSVVDRAIEALSLKQFDKMEIDMILMSPPCQPFTRVGKQKDSDDIRTRSFLHILDLLKKTNRPPSYLLVENVRGFDVSQTREALLETLNTVQYDYQEFLLTPLQFGIPNSRLRYFLIAKKKPLSFSFSTSQEILTYIPDCPEDWLPYKTRAQTEADSDSRNGSENKLDNTCTCRRFFINSDKSAHTSETDGQDLDTSSEPCAKKQKTSQVVESCTDCSENVTVKCDGDTSTHQVLVDVVNADVQDLGCSETKSFRSSTCESTQHKEKDALTELGRDSSITSVCDIADRKEVSVTDDKSENSRVCPSVGGSDCLENYGQNMRQVTEEGSQVYGHCLKLSHFLQSSSTDLHGEKFQDCMLQEKDFKRFVVMDIVTPCSRKSNCFTKRYGRFMEGAGSIVQTSSDNQAMERASQLKQEVVKEKIRETWGEKETGIISSLRLRYFTPREIANILCFPASFSFASDLTVRQLYMALGNSLNVHIVAVLIKLLTDKDDLS